jgi:hypothetical protein
VLVGIAFVAFALDDRIPRRVIYRMAQTLLDARAEARANELRAAARTEAESLADWNCSTCQEANPGTFELCWNCGQLTHEERQKLSHESEAVLALDAATYIGRDRESHT